MVYAATMRKSLNVVLWQIIIEEFGPNILHKAGVDNIVYDTLSRFPYTSINKYAPITREYQCCVNKLFTINRAEKNKAFFPINIFATTIRYDKSKYQTQHIYFGSGIWLLESRS